MRLKLSILLVCLAGLFYFGAGTYKASHFSRDFIPVYSGARCLIHGCNPYQTDQLEHQFLEGSGKQKLLGPDLADFWRGYIPVYPPSTFLVLAPMALFKFSTARFLWAILSGGLFVIAATVVIFACPEGHRWIAAILASMFLAANVSVSLLAEGNPTPFAMALLIIGIVLFLSNRYLWLATVMLMLSLAVKPQMGGVILLYFLAKRIHRWHTVAAMAGAVAILLTAGLILGIRPQSRDWIPALRANVEQSIQPGQVNDPRPDNSGAIGIVNLQTVTSVFFQDSKVFNAVAWGVFALLLAVWVGVAFKTNSGAERHYLMIASLAILSLFPIYHRSGDDMMLLITVPAIVDILIRRRSLGLWISFLTFLLCMNGYTIALRTGFVAHHGGLAGLLQHKVFFILLLRPQCLLLLALFGLYLAAMFIMGSARDNGPLINPGERATPLVDA